MRWRERTTRALRVLVVAGGVLAPGMLAPAPADAAVTCPPSATLVRIEEKVCPANDRRPPIVRQRACCQNPQGRIRCDHFAHCPRSSPS